MTSLTAEDKIIQQGMYQFIICNHSLSNSKNKNVINKFILSDIFILCYHNYLFYIFIGQNHFKLQGKM